MAERGIPFSSPMVRAERAGLKTQTRRVIPIDDRPILATEVERGFPGYLRRGMPSNAVNVRGALPYMKCDAPPGSVTVSARVRPPYEPGDLLWVREPLRRVDGLVTYDADGSRVLLQTDGRVEWAWKVNYLASRYCPRWASRTTLRVEEVRVERLQAITEEDARAEGVALDALPGHRYESHRRAFTDLWDSINGARPGASWTSNPWVWVVRFARVEVPRG